MLGFEDSAQPTRLQRYEPRAVRHTRVDVDVAVGNPPPKVVVEPAPPDVIVEQPPPVVVERSEPSVVVVERRPFLIVREPPPAVIIERRAPPPHGAHIWIDGYWSHDGHRFVCARGRHERAEHGRHYVPTRWAHTERGWELHPGRWE